MSFKIGQFEVDGERVVILVLQVAQVVSSLKSRNLTICEILYYLMEPSSPGVGLGFAWSCAREVTAVSGHSEQLGAIIPVCRHAATTSVTLTVSQSDILINHKQNLDLRDL